MTVAGNGRTNVIILKGSFDKTVNDPKTNMITAIK
jgi:hypothetical protein